MKALLICPGDRMEIAALSENAPLSNIPILGKTLIEYWLEHLAAKGAKEVLVLATDRPEKVRELVGIGGRWGLRIEVLPELRELTAAEARAKYRGRNATNWLTPPLDAQLMDHLPEFPEYPLFASYAGFIAAQRAFMPQAATSDRLGLREIRPGIWTGLHARIAPDAELLAPCWIGDEVIIGSRAIVGPMAVVESRSFVERDAAVSNSVVGPRTFIGESVEVKNSIAFGDTLTNWKLNSSVKVSDAYLLCSLAKDRAEFKRVSVIGRVMAALVMLISFPFALFPMARAAFRGLPVFRSRVAIRPRRATVSNLPGDRLIYYELTDTGGWLRRWPQLWSVVRGEFAWVGNRPLSPLQAADLETEFERLWLTAPLGLICLADAHGIYDAPSNDARAHASYYAVRASRKLDALIFIEAMFRFVFGFPYVRVRDAVLRAVHSVSEDRQKTT